MNTIYRSSIIVLSSIVTCFYSVNGHSEILLNGQETPYVVSFNEESLQSREEAWTPIATIILKEDSNPDRRRKEALVNFLTALTKDVDDNTIQRLMSISK